MGKDKGSGNAGAGEQRIRFLRGQRAAAGPTVVRWREKYVGKKSRQMLPQRTSSTIITHHSSSLISPLVLASLVSHRTYLSTPAYPSPRYSLQTDREEKGKGNKCQAHNQRLQEEARGNQADEVSDVWMKSAKCDDPLMPTLNTDCTLSAPANR